MGRVLREEMKKFKVRMHVNTSLLIQGCPNQPVSKL